MAAGEKDQQGPVPTTGELTSRDRRDHVLARLGWDRMGHRVRPGLYSLGKPGQDSPVFVTANYTLSFDALRSSVAGMDCYILVLNTGGVNVWCAAGKGTFGTRQLVSRVKWAGLDRLVSHRRLILPQLGAPGVDAGEVAKKTGFRVEYGPVRAEDIPEYMRAGRATPEMRRVRFDAVDRAVLIPVELTGIPWWIWPVPLVLAVLGIWGGVAMFLMVILFGLVAFPLLLPYLPTREFATKGFVLGAGAAFLFTLRGPGLFEMELARWGADFLVAFLLMAPWIAFLALNFTGSTTFTSRTGVRREIFRYVPVIAATFIAGVALLIALTYFINMG